ncbi:hypothetical protein [Methylocystis sp. Sn-Cys]|uniref:hypothetical protein n=1 Tax=Methylocystis sp. Sn-Cys TaxID=1701263 RepID=UPI001923FCEA|nr:hypothetical protein [Methylocystis sp. Sn-Cys]MBL1255632.1 hypothetical protein [Methylocystis sp. Sn-Cys]
MDTLAADFAVCSSFSFKKREKLSLDIVVLGGRDDMIEEDALSAWREETLGQTALLMFAGGLKIKRVKAYEVQPHSSGYVRTLVRGKSRG